MIDSIKSFSVQAVLCILLFILIAGVSSSVSAPHIVFGYVNDYPGKTPAAGTAVTAYIDTRPDEKINTSVYEDRAWSVNVGNFPTSWKAGEILIIEISNTYGTNSTAVVLDNTGVQQAENMTVPGASIPIPSSTPGGKSNLSDAGSIAAAVLGVGVIIFLVYRKLK